MKIHLLILFPVFLFSCAQTPKSSGLTSSDLSPEDKDLLECEIRARDRRASWEFSKLEKHYEELKKKPFYFSDELLARAVEEKDWNKAEYYAKEYLASGEKYKDDWNYGNSIFDGNIALAGVEMSRGRKKTALIHLGKAAATPGSPQLDSFGPFNNDGIRYILTEIFKTGEKQALIDFANKAKVFVTKNRPHVNLTDEQKKNSDRVTNWNLDRIERFIKQVSSNQTPDYKDSLLK